ncbi:hypothetical protein LSTR_LSTR005315 [Laodelphax striatellus]|uniref:Tudor domain-containing protein n=1 Tax=Laodelphax striatellus TaxID=195883 RepID=A0A482X7Z7_LAOST|nr:hypothetical protein LSTR_LSTR005315 [Laodelphax striatellus]
MEELYVRQPNEMDSDGQDGDNNMVWDDSLLVKAYDRAVSDAKGKVRSKYTISQKVHPEKSDKTGWQEGDFCRAVFTDGVEYEAQILNISRNQCVIKYLGYGNEETVHVKDLLVSHGEEAREQQCKIANIDEQSNDYDNDMYFADPMRMGLPSIPPPPPPHVMNALCNVSESEALSSMLMSWYMSGYHTGFYQGLMKSKMEDHK